MAQDDESNHDDIVTFHSRRQYEQQYRADDDYNENDDNDIDNNVKWKPRSAQEAGKDDFESLTAFLDQERSHTGCSLSQLHFKTIDCSQNSFPENNDNEYDDGDDDDCNDDQEHISAKGLNGVDFVSQKTSTKGGDRSLLLDNIAALRQAMTKKKSNVTTINSVATKSDFSAAIVTDMAKPHKRPHTTFVDETRKDVSAATTMVVETQLSRPMHWEGSSVKRTTPTASTSTAVIASGGNWSQVTRTIGSNRHKDISARAKKLSDATKQSILAPAKPAKALMRTPLSTSTSTGGLVTFAPAFLGNGKHDETSVGNPTLFNDDNPQAVSYSSLLQATPRPHMVAGPLLQTLRQIRVAVDGDVVRLQSGMYPPEKKDRNDPRQKASLHMIISIVGALFPWRMEEKVMALARVHTTEEDDTHRSLVYVTFAHATARTLSLTPGSTVCIYNAIVLPGDPSIVIATQLCEAVHGPSQTTTTMPVQLCSQCVHERM